MDAEVVLEFWLGRRDQTPPDAARVARWFMVDAELDREIDERFESLVGQALAGGLDSWERDPRERTALIVLLDQFPRNLYRGDPRSFAGDPRALDLVARTTDDELDQLHALERYFLIMPRMHSERLADQIAGEAAYARQAAMGPEAFRALFENGLSFATRHRVVIESFGRFPHRNAVLGRASTEEERAFLAEHETGF